MNCSSPITIKRPGFPDAPIRLQKDFEKPFRFDTMVVPCGKCMACLKSRQNDFSFRIRSEAEAKGSMVFITLTYRDECLPLVSTLWRSSKVDGSCERLSPPEFVCYSGREDYWDYRKDMRLIAPSKSPRYVDCPIMEDDEFSYFSRITPSVCRVDVQKWLKRCRVYFERKECKTLDFSYSICSEYGLKLCRPHYHVVLMGVSEDEAQKFASFWPYGFTKVDKVWRVNPSDQSDGFSKVASYVAKYVAKGEFECQSVKDCTAMSCRQMNSQGLGKSIISKYRSYVLCYDMLGEYDPKTLFSAPLKRYLRRDEIAKLIAEIPKRLVVRFGDKACYSIPRIFRNKIFYEEIKSQDSEKVYCRPSKLWRMVVDAIQSQYAELDRREFAQLLSNKSPREVSEAVAKFNLMQASFAKSSDDSRKKDYQTRLQSSVF